ncbi:MAG: hypothetical protein ACI9MR_001024 [Myxococcota bacterium]|jgi:hypothetical protein
MNNLTRPSSLGLTLLGAALFVLVAGCSDASSVDDDTDVSGDSAVSTDTSSVDSVDPTDSTTSDDTDSADTVGPIGPRFDGPNARFELELASWGFRLIGAIPSDDGINFHTETEREGQCRLLRYAPAFCEPSCTPPAVCVDAACVSPADFLSAGEITLSGFGAATVTVTPTSFGQYGQDGESPTATDAGPTVTMSAAGDVVPAFSIDASPMTAPVPDNEWVAAMEARADGEDVTLTWSDAVPGARIYLRMTTGIGTHGGISPVEVECESADTGALTLPGGYLDALYAGGWSCGECGGNDVWRYSAGEATVGAFPIEFRVQARTQFWYHPNF